MIPCGDRGKDCVPDRDTVCFIESSNAQCETTQVVCELMYKRKDNKSELDDIKINETCFFMVFSKMRFASLKIIRRNSIG